MSSRIHILAGVVHVLLTVALCSFAWAQDRHALSPSGDQESVRKSLMHFNNVIVTPHNTGTIGGEDPLGQFGWKGLPYLYNFGFLLAAEVQSESGDTLHIVDDGYWLANYGDFSPDYWTKWGWLPKPESINPASGSMAVSNDRTTPGLLHGQHGPEKTAQERSQGWASHST